MISINDPLITHRDDDRNNYIDWIRAVAVLLLVLDHSLLSFYTPPLAFPILLPYYYQSAWGIVLYRIVASWIMPTVMITAGYAACRSMGKRTEDEFLRERRERLLVPMFFTTCIIIPLCMIVANDYRPTLGHGWFLLDLLIFSFISTKIDFTKLPIYFLTIFPFVCIVFQWIWFLDILYQLCLFVSGFKVGSRFSRKLCVPYFILGILACIFAWDIYWIRLAGQFMLSYSIVSIPISCRELVPYLRKYSIGYYIVHFPVLAILAYFFYYTGTDEILSFLLAQLALPITLLVIRIPKLSKLLGIKDMQ